MKYRMTLALVFISGLLIGQTIADFENYDLPIDSFINGSNPDDVFASGNISLSNDFNEEYMAWSGFAITTGTDTMTAGFSNQYSSISGGGHNESETYAISHVLGSSSLHTEGMASGETVNGLYVNNATYAYLSMKNGDQFAKKFGGPTGDDPDFFKLAVNAYLDGEMKDDSVIFYLADFRFEDNTMDYIIDEWTYLDLSSLGRVDSLKFSLSSSDNGSFGMNTPAYFCIDEVETLDRSSSVHTLQELDIITFPNPATDVLFIHSHLNQEFPIEVWSVSGTLEMQVSSGERKINVSKLPQGAYFLKVKHPDGEAIGQFQKVR